MDSRTSAAITSLIAAVNRAEQELRDYSKDPAYRREDQERDRATITGRREAEISRAFEQIEGVEQRVAHDYEQWHRTSWDEAAVMAAERRIETLLSARESQRGGAGLLGVSGEPRKRLLGLLGGPGMTRDMIEAVRRTAPVFLQTHLKENTQPQEIERQLEEIRRASLRSELRFMSPDERRATEEHLDFEQARAAVDGVEQYVRRVRTGAADAKATMALGHALSEGGYEAPPPADDPERLARRQWNSMPASARTAVLKSAGLGVTGAIGEG